MLRIEYIGSHTTVPGWPEQGTIAGLLDAIERWELDTRWDLSTDPRFQPHPDRAPFRGPALRCAGSRFDPALGCTVYLTGAPVFPDAPTAVSYSGNFIGYSYGFGLATDDRELIAQLDAAIARNLARDWRLPGAPLRPAPEPLTVGKVRMAAIGATPGCSLSRYDSVAVLDVLDGLRDDQALDAKQLRELCARAGVSAQEVAAVAGADLAELP
jgi:hypothetical protein